ncbi:MAG: Methionine--tRNA ligase [Candidatus Parcubacteria bacterium]|jgi:methionyl-tRNA synthetase
MTIDQFLQSDLRVGTVLSASVVDGSEKLVRLSVDLGESGADGVLAPRTILAGIRRTYSAESLVGRQVIVVANLDPRPLLGEVSYGMVLAASDSSGNLSLLTLDTPLAPGSRVR